MNKKHIRKDKVEFLLRLDTVVGVLVATLIAVGIFFYAMTTILPILSPHCPYVTPLVKPGIRSIRRMVWRFWCCCNTCFNRTAVQLGKYYSFPGDEMGIRRDTELDLLALVEAAIVDSIIVLQ